MFVKVETGFYVTSLENFEFRGPCSCPALGFFSNSFARSCRIFRHARSVDVAGFCLLNTNKRLFIWKCQIDGLAFLNANGIGKFSKQARSRCVKFIHFYPIILEFDIQRDDEERVIDVFASAMSLDRLFGVEFVPKILYFILKYFSFINFFFMNF